MEQARSVGDEEIKRERLKVKSDNEGKGGITIRLLPVPLAHIPWGTQAPVDLYRQAGRELSLLFRKGQDLAVEAYSEIAKHTDCLYYDKDTHIDWQTLVDKSLSNILQAPLPIETKTEIAYGSATHITQKTFEDFTEESYQDVRDTVVVLNRLMDEPGALDSFLQLTIHDYYTYTHSVHVYLYASLLTRALIGDENSSFHSELGVGYLLHDIGKKDISPEILNKPGSLDDDEWIIIKKHSQTGFDLLTQVSGALSDEVADIVLQHHERCDGSGYPNGRKEHEIGRYGKICAIADVFDALTTKRSYKKAISKLEALSIMKNSKGHFDEKMLMRFIRI